MKMSSLKETLKIQTKGAIVAAEETAFSIKGEFKALPNGKRWWMLFLILLIIPGFIAARYGTSYVLATQYARNTLSAHPAFTAAFDPEVGPVTIIRNPTGSFSAFAEITNQNLDLSTTSLGYTATFTNNAGETVHSIKGVLYLLPNEKKIVVIPRIDVTDVVASGTITLDKVSWQKKLSLPEVSLRVSEPSLYDEANPLMFVAEGAVVNNSPYALSTVRLAFLLYDANNKVIGVSQRDEFRVQPFARRAYKQLWPVIY
nr:hypothetical protein [bacterium]